MDSQEKKLLLYSEDRTQFGRGPKKPNSTGHCNETQCGDAVGVRVWWQIEPKTHLMTITNVWWSGEGCIYCMAVAALLAKRLIGASIDLGNFADIVLMKIIDSEFPKIPVERKSCVDTAMIAFQRAICWNTNVLDEDWMMNEDIDYWKEVANYE